MRIILVLITLISIGCSGVVPAVSSTEDDITGETGRVPQYQTWADGTLSWNEASANLEFIPTRMAEGHHDVWPFLNPPECYDCVLINVTAHDPVAKTLTAEVTLRNPTPLSGFFVRGLVIADPTTSLEMLNQHYWWKPADFSPEQTPAPFRIFAVADTEYRFGSGESHMQEYQFSYGSLADFGKCEYRVIARFPKSPGEIRSIYYPMIHGAFTTSGGFISLRVLTDEFENTPDKIVWGYKVVDGIASNPINFRQEPGGDWLTWFPGEATTADTAYIWVFASTTTSTHALARRLDIPIQDVVPTPNRTFPVVTEGCKVFVDQLKGGMTTEQTQFMATNCVGSQKLTKNIADSIRIFNPDFIILQYHLAFGEGDISNVNGNDWIKNWEFVNSQEDFFEHRFWSSQYAHRVLQLDWNWYLTDPISDWKNYFIGNTIERMDPLGDQFDAVFADSASQPWNTDPPKWWPGSDDAYTMFIYWTPRTQAFFTNVANAYHTLPTYIYLIPNAGSYVTTISDITYHQCDGVMIEGFCHWSPGSYFTEVDWCLQQNRTRDLAISDKIILCQTGVEVANTLDRGFVHGSYMLLQDNYTYLNMLGPWGLEPQWWPEYDWNPGPAVEDWTTVDELQDAGGCYVRHFSNGIVIVNPSDVTRYYTTTKSYSHSMYAEGGLLPADGVPTGIATGPIIEPGSQELPPHSAWLGIG